MVTDDLWLVSGHLNTKGSCLSCRKRSVRIAIALLFISLSLSRWLPSLPAMWLCKSSPLFLLFLLPPVDRSCIKSASIPFIKILSSIEWAYYLFFSLFPSPLNLTAVQVHTLRWCIVLHCKYKWCHCHLTCHSSLSLPVLSNADARNMQMHLWSGNHFSFFFFSFSFISAPCVSRDFFSPLDREERK